MAFLPILWLEYQCVEIIKIDGVQLSGLKSSTEVLNQNDIGRDFQVGHQERAAVRRDAQAPDAFLRKFGNRSDASGLKIKKLKFGSGSGRLLDEKDAVLDKGPVEVSD